MNKTKAWQGVRMLLRQAHQCMHKTRRRTLGVHCTQRRQAMPMHIYALHTYMCMRQGHFVNCMPLPSLSSKHAGSAVRACEGHCVVVRHIQACMLHINLRHACRALASGLPLNGFVGAARHVPVSPGQCCPSGWLGVDCSNFAGECLALRPWVGSKVGTLKRYICDLCDALRVT